MIGDDSNSEKLDGVGRVVICHASGYDGEATAHLAGGWELGKNCRMVWLGAFGAQSAVT